MAHRSVGTLATQQTSLAHRAPLGAPAMMRMRRLNGAAMIATIAIMRRHRRPRPMEEPGG